MFQMQRSYTQWLALLMVVVGLVFTQTPALGASQAGGVPALQAEIDALQAQVNALQAQEGADVSSLQAQIDALQQQIEALEALVNPPPPATGFVDNGDGTITDHQTGLMWEKSDDAAGLTDKDLVRTWNLAPSNTSDSATGSSIFTWLDRLNGRLTNDPSQPGFAGHTDWRVPTVFELQTILLAPSPCGTSPCIDPIFGPTAAAFYWSSTTLAIDPSRAWFVNFNGGFVGNTAQFNPLHVRAVRGGR